MYLVQERSIMENELKNEIKKQIAKYQYMKDRYWRDLQQCKTLLQNELSNLSVKQEDELTKKDLLLLISRNCDYMNALNHYNYYRDELIKMRAQNNEGR